MPDVKEARVTTKEGARLFLEAFHKAKNHKPCCHGHWDCSWFRDGPCLDETLANFPDEEA